MEDNRYEYFAFISYSSHDAKWGERLQRKLEYYSLPATLCREREWKRQPMRPIFFAPTDIRSGGLTDELKAHLRASQHLIVICSPHSAQSKWVGLEIEYFHSLGRSRNIHFFMVAGEPHSGDPATECFHPITAKIGLPEILAANVHEQNYRWGYLNRERAYVQLITEMLDLRFDEIWQRHKHRMVEKTIAWAVGVMAVVTAMVWIWLACRPMDVAVKLQEASVPNDSLPALREAVVTMRVGDEVKRDTIPAWGETITFKHVPRAYEGRAVNFTVACADFVAVDTTIQLQERVTIDMYRDTDEYGKITFTLWDSARECVMPYHKVVVAGIETESDEDGRVFLSIPLSQQRTRYKVSTTVALEDSILRMPTDEHTYVTTLIAE